MASYGLPKDQKVLAAIGAISLRQGQLDNAMKMLVMTLANVTWEEALDATSMHVGRDLRERVRKLAKQRIGEGPALVQLDALLQRARIATDERNEIVHSFWGMEKKWAVIRDRHHTYKRAPSLRQLETLADDLASIRLEITSARQSGFIFEALERRSAASPAE